MLSLLRKTQALVKLAVERPGVVMQRTRAFVSSDKGPSNSSPSDSNRTTSPATAKPQRSDTPLEPASGPVTKFIQLLPVVTPCEEYSKGKILLCRWASGDYADRYTGLMGEVKDESGMNYFTDSIRKVLLSFVPEETTLPVFNIALKGVLTFDSPVETEEFQYLVYLKQDYKVETIKPSSVNPDCGALEWFDWDKIPYEKMPEDDAFWYPEVLKGKNVRGRFEFGGPKELTLKRYNLYEVEKFDGLA